MDEPVSAGQSSMATANDREQSAASDEAGAAAAATPQAAPALVVDGVSKQFGTGDAAVQAVDDVSMTVERGEVVGLLGPNGAGKTTLIKCVLGMVLPDTGRIELLGRDVSDGRRGVYSDVDAMLEGARNDYWRLTVRENLRYFATISGVTPASVAARHDRLLTRFGLAEKADTPVRDLSRGMKQKVSLASVLAGGADLVFLDEPTLGLDVESSRTLQRELRRLARDEGLTILISSHDMGVIEAVCDRVVVMADGRVVADDTVDALVHRAGQGTVRIASPDIDATVVTTLRAEFEVRDVHQTADRTRVDLAVAGDDLYRLMAVLQANDVTLEQIRTVDPDLEDIFVALTDSPDGAAADTANGRRSS
ncbi:ABC transporter ATP-binding protein [Halosegnis sp.]|uniref:ABC transporter ATP-binding protein n=1 Tax=Halosegnis sp. TaxID=2864959 RepID=UPI0035D4AB5D